MWCQMPLGSTLISLSSFYGLLDILSGTELNPGQRETGRISLYTIRWWSNCCSVQTAKESCELLLKVATVDSDNSQRVYLIVTHLDYRLHFGL